MCHGSIVFPAMETRQVEIDPRLAPATRFRGDGIRPALCASRSSRIARRLGPGIPEPRFGRGGRNFAKEIAWDSWPLALDCSLGNEEAESPRRGLSRLIARTRSLRLREGTNDDVGLRRSARQR